MPPSPPICAARRRHASRPIRRARAAPPGRRPVCSAAALAGARLASQLDGGPACDACADTDFFAWQRPAGSLPPHYRRRLAGRRRLPAAAARPLLLRAPAVGRATSTRFNERPAPRCLAASWARTPCHDRRHRRRALRRLGAERRARQRGRRLQSTGTAAATRCACAAAAASGSCSFPGWPPASSTSSRSATATPARVLLKTDPYARAMRAAPGHRLDRRATAAHALARRRWLAARARRDWLHAPLSHLRGAPRLLARACRRQLPELPRARRRSSCPYVRAWASRTSNCCRSPSIRSTIPGATRPPAISRPPAATARPTTCATSSTPATAPASA